jgi:hypothetical protein
VVMCWVISTLNVEVVPATATDYWNTEINRTQLEQFLERMRNSERRRMDWPALFV